MLEDKSTSIVNDNDDKMLSKSLNNDINNSAHFNLSKMNTHIRANSAIVHSRSKVSSTYSGIRTEISTMNFGNKPWNISLSQNKRNDSLKRLMKEYHEKKVSKIKLKIDKTEGNIDKKDWIIAGVNSKRKPRSVNYINEYEEFDEEDDKITQDPMVRITITKIEKSNQAKTHNRSTNSLIPDKLVTSENSWPTDALNQQIRNKNQKNMMKYNKDIDANSSNDEE